MTQKHTGSASIAEYFNSMDDPRVDRTRYHKLIDIIVIAVCAVICGAKSWDDIELFGYEKHDWLKRFLELPGGIPSHDTFNRVFAHLDPDQFRASFVSWVQALVTLTDGEVVAIDGKTVRRSHTGGKNAIHMISAWATANALVLGQQKVNDKSNEITAIPKLLKLLELKGCIITIDAMGCQKEIAKTVLEGDADYVLAVKGNQKTIYQDLRHLFTDGTHDGDYCQTVERSRGRKEVRRCRTITDPTLLPAAGDVFRYDWPGLTSLAQVVSERTIKSKTTREIRYYLSSLNGNAQQILSAVRSHWGIENSLHWVLDVTFREDESRIRAGYAAENFTVLRHIALNLLKHEKTTKRSIKGKQLKSALSEKYLEKVMGI